MTFQEYRFRNVASLINGRAYLMPELQDSGKYKIVRVGNFTGKDEWFFSDMELEPEKYCENGDLLYKWACTFGPEIWKGDKTIYHYHIWKVLCNPVLLDKTYFFYYLKYYTPLWLSGTNGATMVHITKASMEKKKLYLPTLPQQQKIASILSAYDSQIEINQKRIKLLEQMAENLYKEWFVRFRFPGYEKVEFEGGVPKGWKLERLEDFGIVLETGSRPKGGIDSSVETGVPSLGAEAINGLAEFDYNSLKLVPQDYYDKMKRGKSKGNHILVYKDGAYIGKVTIFRNGFPFKEYSINEHVFFLNTKDCDYQNYLYFTLHQKAFFSLMKNLNRNAAQPGLSQQDMNGIKVFKPTKDVVNTFNQYAEPIFNEVFSLAKEIRLLTHQRDLLLPRLMSGKLSI